MKELQSTLLSYHFPKLLLLIHWALWVHIRLKFSSACDIIHLSFFLETLFWPWFLNLHLSGVWLLLLLHDLLTKLFLFLSLKCWFPGEILCCSSLTLPTVPTIYVSMGTLQRFLVDELKSAEFIIFPTIFHLQKRHHHKIHKPGVPIMLFLLPHCSGYPLLHNKRLSKHRG